MSYSNGLLPDQSYQTVNKYVQKGLPGVGFKLTVTGDYDVQNKKLVNVKSGTDSNDAVNKSQLDATTNLLHGSRAGDVVNDKAVIYSNTGAVHANSLYIEDPPNQGNSNEVRIMTEHQSYPNIHLNIPDLHNFDGHGGRPKSELMVTSVEQTVTGKKVFENIEVHDPTSNNQAANKSYADTKLSLTGGTMTGDLILPPHNYPIPGNTNKVINYESQREIFLSRQESFPMQADINMNNNFIQNIATPTSSHQVTNKGYCDYNFLNRQKGGMLMDSLSMNQNDLFEIPAPKYGSSAANKNYVDGEIGKIASVNTTQLIKKDGSVPMAADFDMGTHKIINVGQPTTVTDAATKGYIDKTLAESHLLSSHKSNEFKYLDDPNETSSEYNITIDAFTDFNESPHKNKKAFQITLTKDVGTNDYRSRMGFNLYPLPLGTYTIIFEYYFPENTNIQLSCQSTTAYVHKQIQKDFTDYSKLLVQINNNSKTTPDYLFFTIHGTAVVNNPEGYIIVYGVKDWSDSVDPNIYDDGFYVQMFQYKNGDMQMQTNINVNNHKITNLNKGINDTDAVNKLQLDSVSVHTNNQTYREIFNEFYDLVETIRFNVNTNSYGLVILGVKPNLFFQSNRLITNYDRSSGIQLSNSYINLGDDVDQNSSYTIFISLYFSDDIKIQFSDINHNIFYPSFSITYNNSRLRINRSLHLRHHITIPADFKNKQVMLWVCHNAPNNLYRFAISNHTSFIQSISSPASFKTKILRIIYNNHVKKIGWVKKFININSLDHHRIMLEELREGSFFR